MSQIRAFESAVADSQCLGPIQFIKMVTVIGHTPPVHIWLLASPLPFHLRHVQHIPSHISLSLSKPGKSLTNTSNSRNKTKPGIIPEGISRRKYQNNRPTLLQRQRHLFGARYLDVCFVDLSQHGACLSVTVG